MLESILGEINSSLKEITKVLGDLCTVAKEPIVVDAEVENTQPFNNCSTTAQQAIPQVAEPISQAPMQQVQQPVVEPIPQTIPTTQATESFTQEQLAVAMSRAVSAGKMIVIQGILQSFGVQALTQLNPTEYNKVATMLKEAGVEV